MDNKKEFTLERVLTVSVVDYCKMVGKELTDFTPSGVQYTSHTGYLDEKTDGNQIIGVRFSEKIPANTEVVVDFRVSMGGNYSKDDVWYIATGTALIPKN